jgi:hypothetical protein
VRPYFRSIGKSAAAKKTFLAISDSAVDVRSKDQMGTDATNLRPTTFRLENSSFLRFPWMLLASSVLQRDPTLSDSNRGNASQIFHALVTRGAEIDGFLAGAETWMTAETLFCVSKSLESEPGFTW